MADDWKFAQPGGITYELGIEGKDIVVKVRGVVLPELVYVILPTCARCKRQIAPLNEQGHCGWCTQPGERDANKDSTK